MRDGQTLSNRQDFPGTAVQGHSRRRDAASALCGGEGAGSVTRRKIARTGTSNGTGTRTSRLVGGHEVKGEGSAREKVLDTSIFWAEKEVDPRSEKWKMMMASQAIQQQARMWHARRVSSVFLPRKRHLRTLVVRSPPAFFQPSNPARRAETVWVSFWTLVLHKRVFFASVTCAQSSRHPFASELRHKRATLEKGAPNTMREGGFCFASAGRLKGSEGRVVESSSNTSREGGSLFFLASVDTSRESGGEEVGS